MSTCIVPTWVANQFSDLEREIARLRAELDRYRALAAAYRAWDDGVNPLRPEHYSAVRDAYNALPESAEEEAIPLSDPSNRGDLPSAARS